MAVTVVSSPPVSPFVLSASYPAIIEMSSTVYGNPGITQFRYVAEVTAIIDLGVKRTVPSVATLTTGFFDVRELFKLLLLISPTEWGGTSLETEAITQITAPIQQASFVQFSFQVVIKEQYFNAGVFTTNTGPTLVFMAGRGFTDKTNSEWFYCNFSQLGGDFTAGNWMPYSGHALQVIAMKVKDPSWTSAGSKPWFGVLAYSEPGTVLVGEWWFLRDTISYQGAVYVPLRFPGFTDQDDFEELEIFGFISPVANLGPGIEEVEDILLTKTVQKCEDEVMVMFRDRFFQWSFMSFSMYNSTTVNTQPQAAEAIEGRFRYNVKSSDVLNLNTDWMDDIQNELMKDLIATEKCFLVDPDDGSLEELTVVPNSLRLQTSKVDKLFQYQMQFRKSLDNFKA